MKKYDILLVGAGLHNAVFARLATNKGLRCCIIEKRNHIGGNIYDKNIEGINVHMYGPHIFHTNNEDVWKFVNEYTKFNSFQLNTIANYKGELYNLPFNMNTFNKMWGVITPKEAMKEIENQKLEIYISEPKNLAEQAISMVGTEIFYKLIDGYTEKQWGRPCTQLPADIIKRIPVRFTYNNNYFNDKYQGIPVDGYTQFINNLLSGCDVILGVDYFDNKDYYDSLAETIVYSGCIDQYFNYRLGKLEYRSVDWTMEKINEQSYQGNAIINYTDIDVKYTRIIEHKYFDIWNDEALSLPYTYITKEYSKSSGEPSYPINNDRNNNLYNEYKELAKLETNVIFGGRLGEYKYYDMDKVIASAFENFKLYQIGYNLA